MLLSLEARPSKFASSILMRAALWRNVSGDRLSGKDIRAKSALRLCLPVFARKRSQANLDAAPHHRGNGSWGPLSERRASPQRWIGSELSVVRCFETEVLVLNSYVARYNVCERSLLYCRTLSRVYNRPDWPWIFELRVMIE
jgi:hypothetical protein